MKVGIDLGGSHIAIGLVDNGKIVQKDEKVFNKLNIINKKDFIENYIKEYVNANRNRIESIGIAIPGTIVDDIISSLKEDFNMEIKIKNDAKCAGIAEFEFGSIKGYKNAVFITLGTGIGGAVFCNGKLVEGNCFSGTEIGHMIIEKNGNLCKCGKNGCFETYASMRVLKTNLKKSLDLNDDVHGEELLQIVKNDMGNEKISGVIDKYIDYLCVGISNLINIFEPDVIAIGGSFIHFSEILLPKIKYTLLNSELLFNKRNDINIKVAELGNDAGIIGSSIL